MRKNMLSKILVVGVIFLFICVGIKPTTADDISVSKENSITRANRETKSTVR